MIHFPNNKFLSFCFKTGRCIESLKESIQNFIDKHNKLYIYECRSIAKMTMVMVMSFYYHYLKRINFFSIIIIIAILSPSLTYLKGILILSLLWYDFNKAKKEVRANQDIQHFINLRIWKDIYEKENNKTLKANPSIK